MMSKGEFSVAILVTLLLGTVALTVAAQNVTVPKKSEAPTYYDYWNECVRTFQEEEVAAEPGGLWFTLQESYKSDPPDYVTSPDRLERLNTLIGLTERRLKALKQLRNFEKGKTQ